MRSSTISFLLPRRLTLRCWPSPQPTPSRRPPPTSSIATPCRRCGCSSTRGTCEQLRSDYRENIYYAADFQWRNIRVRNVAVRSRGGGSRNPTKPALRVDFNRYTTGQQFLGLKSLVLDNLWQDGSFVAESTAMAFFERMGQAAPRESFCRLYINNVYHGVYAIVESVDTDFLARTLGEKDGIPLLVSVTSALLRRISRRRSTAYKRRFRAADPRARIGHDPLFADSRSLPGGQSVRTTVSGAIGSSSTST